LLSSLRLGSRLKEKAFAALEILLLIIIVGLASSPHSASAASQTWTDTIKLFKDSTSVCPDIRTFTNNLTVGINVIVEMTGNSSIGNLKDYRLWANNTDFVVISEGVVVRSTNTYYGLQLGKRLVFSVEAKPKNSVVPGDTAIVEVRISYSVRTMHVESITFKKSGTQRLDIMVTIYNETSRPVPAATVFMNIQYPDQSVRSVSTVTNTKGVATYSINKPAKGTYTVTVTQVTHATHIYDPTANKQTTASFTV
jgi:hypothetical protein